MALAATSGVFAGLMIGSWQAFVSELVPREALLNAVTLNSAQFNAARAFGPAIGGIVLALVRPGWAFFVNGSASFVAVIGALLAMRLDRVVAKAVGRMHIVADFRETIRYVRASAGIRTCVIVVAALGFFESPVFQLVVVFAEDVFIVDTWVFGVFSAALGIGAILGTPFVAGWGGEFRRETLVVGAILLTGGSMTLFALAAECPTSASSACSAWGRATWRSPPASTPPSSCRSTSGCGARSWPSTCWASPFACRSAAWCRAPWPR